ncbi:P-loop containing nucleoside triphosphate hydrolase protein [Xylaria castorea]|nr:P-loop containing nucleoside triphosphate hydrolase protein [Xylaria castorea]
MAATATLKTTAGAFVPRTAFEVSSQITRSYFLGHHTAALSSMRKVLSNIGLILECRDSRVPLTSANPLLESSLAGRDRIIVYTKSDLCAPATSNRWIEKQQRLLAEWHTPHTQIGEGSVGVGGGRTQVVFTDERNARTVSRLLDAVKERAVAQDSLVGLRALVVGMPNAGKSTLLNALRRVGMHKPKAARTGAQPGITRKLSTPVRIVAASPPLSPASSSSSSSDKNAYIKPTPHPTSSYSYEHDVGEGIFVVDTPGVFVPYVSDVESMLKLSLVGCVKDGLVPSETVADYMLFLLNRRDPSLYAHICDTPTNDIREFLDAVARRTGKLLKGGVPAREQAADWVVQQWRRGLLGRFGLDDVTEDGLKERARRRREQGDKSPLSMNQARKREKEARKVKNAAKRATALDSGA